MDVKPLYDDPATRWLMLLHRAAPPPRRGMQCTSYVRMAPGVTVDQLRDHLKGVYASEFFVKVGARGGGGPTARAACVRAALVLGHEGQLSSSGRGRLAAAAPRVRTRDRGACAPPHTPPCSQVLDKGVVPHTRHVRGSNFALINVFEVRGRPRALVGKHRVAAAPACVGACVSCCATAAPFPPPHAPDLRVARARPCRTACLGGPWSSA